LTTASNALLIIWNVDDVFDVGVAFGDDKKLTERGDRGEFGDLLFTVVVNNEV
jgi:hypothetical protein